MSLFLGLLIFGASTAALFGLFIALGWMGESNALARRLQRVQGIHVPAPLQGQLLREDPLGRNPWVKELMGRLPRVSSLQETLDRAGVKARVSRFLFVWLVLNLSVGGLVFAATKGSVLAATVGMLSVNWFPMIWVGWRLRRRQRAVERQLPDALKLLANSLRAGHSLGTGLKLVGEEMSPPLGPVFQKFMDEINVGLPFDAAMKRLVYRVGGADVKLMATAILLQRETGGNLAEVVDKMCAVILERMKLRRHVRVLTAQGRFTGWVLGIMPLALALILSAIHPGHLKPLLTEPFGRMMLMMAFGLQVLGVLVMAKIIRIRF
jgi:tight adherence protein B